MEEGDHVDREAARKEGWAEAQQELEHDPIQQAAGVEQGAVVEVDLQEDRLADPIDHRVVPGSCADGCLEALEVGFQVAPALEGFDAEGSDAP